MEVAPLYCLSAWKPLPISVSSELGASRRPCCDLRTGSSARRTRIPSVGILRQATVVITSFLGAVISEPAIGQDCVGDCDGDTVVTVDELVTMVNIALGNRPVDDCLAGDANSDDRVTVDELVTSVRIALAGCQQPTATATATATALPQNSTTPSVPPARTATARATATRTHTATREPTPNPTGTGSPIARWGSARWGMDVWARK
jgi:hypothetical protein